MSPYHVLPLNINTDTGFDPSELAQTVLKTLYPYAPDYETAMRKAIAQATYQADAEAENVANPFLPNREDILLRTIQDQIALDEHAIFRFYYDAERTIFAWQLCLSADVVGQIGGDAW